MARQNVSPNAEQLQYYKAIEIAPNTKMPETNESVFKNLNSDRNVRTAEEVVSHLRDMIESGDLAPGDRLPPERDLAMQLGVSRPTLRAGIRSLSAIGILQSRQGAGTFVAAAEESPTLDPSALRLLSALHGITSEEIFEAHLSIAASIAARAAERAGSKHLDTLAEAIDGMDASLDHPEEHMVHESRFYKTLAAASGNRILAALMNMLAEVLDDHRGQTTEQPVDLKSLTDQYRAIYQAVRTHDPEAALEAARKLKDYRSPALI